MDDVLELELGMVFGAWNQPVSLGGLGNCGRGLHYVGLDGIRRIGSHRGRRRASRSCFSI